MKDHTYTLPDDVRAECLAILRGYDRRTWSEKPEDRRRVEAVRAALAHVGEDYPQNLRGVICDGMVRNCINGRAYPFQSLGLPFMGRSDFYRRRRRFLHDIAENMGIA